MPFRTTITELTKLALSRKVLLTPLVELQSGKIKKYAFLNLTQELFSKVNFKFFLEKYEFAGNSNNVERCDAVHAQRTHEVESV